jgi:hypothetical protein
MSNINWGRVFLCGLVTGVVWGVVAGVVGQLVAQDFLAAIPIGNPFSPFQPGLVAFYSLLWLVMGVWMMWLYAAIRPRYGPGPKTAAIAGLATAVFGVLADAVWVSFGVIAVEVVVAPIAAAVPILIVAAMAGAWLYKE